MSSEVKRAKGAEAISFMLALSVLWPWFLFGAVAGAFVPHYVLGALPVLALMALAPVLSVVACWLTWRSRRPLVETHVPLAEFHEEIVTELKAAGLPPDSRYFGFVSGPPRKVAATTLKAWSCAVAAGIVFTALSDLVGLSHTSLGQFSPLVFLACLYVGAVAALCIDEHRKHLAIAGKRADGSGGSGAVADDDPELEELVRRRCEARLVNWVGKLGLVSLLPCLIGVLPASVAIVVLLLS